MCPSSRPQMKCTFNQPEDDVCSRCIAGGYECVFPGRKPRAPGYVPIMLVSFISVHFPVLTHWRPPSVRMVLRQQIREKDAMIDNLLNRVNPGPTMATPLTLVPARLPLSAKERAEYRDVLTYLERAAQQAGQRFMGDGRTKFDISALEDVMSEDESESEEDAGGPGLGGLPEGLLSPKRAVSPKSEQASQSQSQSQSQHQHQHQPMDSILEVGAPTGIMAIAALQHMGKNAKSVPDSASESSGSKESDAGVAGEAFFLPGESCHGLCSSVGVQCSYLLRRTSPGPQANLQLRRLIVERQSPPDILLSGLVTPDDVTVLFEMYVVPLPLPLTIADVCIYTCMDDDEWYGSHYKWINVCGLYPYQTRGPALTLTLTLTLRLPANHPHPR